MSSELMLPSDRLHFLKKWLLLLICGMMIGGSIGFLLKIYASKTTYTYSVGIEIYHPYKEGMSKKEFQALKLTDEQNVGQYTELVKSEGILSAVNDSLHAKYGVIINNVDLAQMYDSGEYLPSGGFYVACTSSSKRLAKYGLYLMRDQIKQSLGWADKSIRIRTFRTVYYSTPRIQRGVKSVLVYASFVGLFLALLLAIVLDSYGKRKGTRNVIGK